MRKYIILFTSLLCLMLLSACETQPQKVSSVRIGVSLYDQYDIFLSGYMDQFNEFVNEKSYESGVNISVDLYNAAGSQNTQNHQVEKMIQSGCDVICVNLVDRTEPATIINLAKSNQIPVVFFNRELVSEDLELWDQLYYVGAKTSQPGVIQANITYSYIKAHPEIDRNGDGIIQYIMLEGEFNHQDAILRTQTSVRSLEDYGLSLEKSAYVMADWSRDLSKTKMLDLLKSDTYAELILSNNDAMALGAIDAYEELEIPIEQRAIIFGIDGIPDAIEACSMGTLQGTVYNDVVAQAQALLKVSFALATKSSMDDIDLVDDRYYRSNYRELTETDFTGRKDQK